MNALFVLPLDHQDASLKTAGGKGMNLARLARAGFPVPPGFIVATKAYDAFVAANDLAGWILDAANRVSVENPQTLESAAAAIHTRFATGHIPPELADALRNAYAALGRPPVAVRSSATAEDLPGMSFAGQQDTYLNIVAEDALLKAVVECWSSLWTARAIGYRIRNDIAHEGVSLAVIVQEMVLADASGVLFTANPLTGRRTEAVIDATLGLGEALVSGRVEPDHYLVSSDGHVQDKTLGRKALTIHSRAGGGTITLEQDAATRQALPDDAIRQLAQMGRRAADLFGEPQDVEWASVDGRLFLLQSRPITTLYPLPQGMPPEPLQVMFSFGSVQGMLDPMTPIGQDAMRVAVVGGARLFGYDLTEQTQPAIKVAGERLWINVTGLICNRIGQRLVIAALQFIDPGAAHTLQRLVGEGRFPSSGYPRPHTMWRLLRILGPMIVRAIRTLLRPDAERARLLQQTETLIAGFETQITSTTTLGARVRLIRRMAHQAFHYIILQFVPRFGMGMGMAMFNLLPRLVANLPDDAPDVLTLARGLPHNVTTEMDLALWQTAQAIRADPEAAARYRQTDAQTLAAEYLEGCLPERAQSASAAFLQCYGMRDLAGETKETADHPPGRVGPQHQPAVSLDSDEQMCRHGLIGSPCQMTCCSSSKVWYCSTV